MEGALEVDSCAERERRLRPWVANFHCMPSCVGVMVSLGVGCMAAAAFSSLLRGRRRANFMGVRIGARVSEYEGGGVTVPEPAMSELQDRV